MFLILIALYSFAGVNSYKPAPGWQLVGAVVSGIHGLAAGLAVDLAPKGVRVNCISPGWVSLIYLLFCFVLPFIMFFEHRI